MKVRATTNFAGEICMAMGEVRDVPKSVAAPLLKCGYLEQVAAPQTDPANTDPANTDPANTDPANTDPANTDNPDAKTEG